MKPTERKPIKLIERNIARVKADARGKKDHFAWDKEMPGFGLRVRSGRASWVLQYQVHGRQHRIKLGDHPIMSADVARSSAKEEAGKVAASRHRGEAHPILERRHIRDAMLKAEAKRPGDAPFGSRIEEYLQVRTANGSGGHKGGIAGVYNRATYLPEKKSALDKVGAPPPDHHHQASGTNVTDLKSRRSPKV